MLAIAVASLRDFQIFGFELRTVLAILIVLVLGWKNGILVGAASGIAIGSVLGIITGASGTLIASFALSRNDSRIFK